MKSAGRREGSAQTVRDCALIDPDMHVEVNFSFLPSGTRFLTHRSDIGAIDAPRRLVIASNNSEAVIKITSEWLDVEGSAVEILWNPTSNPDFAHSLFRLSNTAPYSAFRQSNVTAHLVLANAETDLTASKTNRLTPEIARLLEESTTENISIPPQVFKQLIWRYSYLLDQIEPLLHRSQSLQEKVNELNEKTMDQNPPRDNQSEIQELRSANERLNEQISEMDKLVSSLEARYDALAGSKLGSLTLKYWKFRKKEK